MRPTAGSGYSSANRSRRRRRRRGDEQQSEMKPDALAMATLAGAAGFLYVTCFTQTNLHFQLWCNIPKPWHYHLPNCKESTNLPTASPCNEAQLQSPAPFSPNQITLLDYRSKMLTQ